MSQQELATTQVGALSKQPLPATTSAKPTGVVGVAPLLVRILSTRRAHNSVGELEFAKWLHRLFDEVVEKNKKTVQKHVLGEGTIALQIGESKVMFSCHIDTVHTHAESNVLNNLQRIFYDESFEHIFLDKSGDATCLGADDGAGIYIMLRMIEAKKPGLYVFHRGEERGGIGAKATVAKHAEFFKKGGYEQCIAFDRPRTTEIITHQGGVECASTTYALELSKRLNTIGEDFQYAPSDKGVYTDSKEYRFLIRECINIGVGYEQQHGRDEFLDYSHLERLTKACIKMDWHTLPVTRVCPVYTPYTPPTVPQFGGMRGVGGAEFGGLNKSKGKAKNGSKRDGVGQVAPLFSKAVEPELELFDEVDAMDIGELISYFGDEEIVNLIVQYKRRLRRAEAEVQLLTELLGV